MLKSLSISSFDIQYNEPGIGTADIVTGAGAGGVGYSGSGVRLT